MPAKEKSTRRIHTPSSAERSQSRERLRPALEASAGAWSDEDHPDLATAQDIERYIRRL